VSVASLALPLLALADTTVSVQSVSPSATVAPGTQVSFSVSSTGFANPYYTVTDSLGGTSVSGADIDSSGNFVWTPTTADSGTHSITVSVSDSLGNTGSATQQIVVTAPASIAVGTVSPGTSVMTGTQVSFTVTPTSFNNPSYSISDSFGGGTLTSSNIDASGNVTWTPQIQDVGTHSITVSASDASGNSASANVTITVSQNTTSSSSGTTASSASSLSSPQVQAILSLLQSFGADQSVINNVAATLGGTPPASTAASAAPAGDGYVFTTFMEEGDSGTQITELQDRLAVLGYFSVAPTGYFGPVTQAAVEQFQAAHGIDQVGYVGPATRAALNGQ
jgi:hypothetical protein